MRKNQVNVAFEILLEEIEAVANAINEEGAQAFQKGDYAKADKASEEGRILTEFRDRVKTLQKEWIKLFSSRRRIALAKKTRKTKRSSVNMLPRGLRTPEEKFRVPILESLLELGGSAPISEVLERVEIKMKGILNKYDRQPLASDPRSIRWRNTAQWCRNTLVKEGLMKSDSPFGMWEISEAGRKRLKEVRQLG